MLALVLGLTLSSCSHHGKKSCEGTKQCKMKKEKCGKEGKQCKMKDGKKKACCKKGEKKKDAKAAK